jgi:hypothetical protein
MAFLCFVVLFYLKAGAIMVIDYEPLDLNELKKELELIDNRGFIEVTNSKTFLDNPDHKKIEIFSDLKILDDYDLHRKLIPFFNTYSLTGKFSIYREILILWDDEEDRRVFDFIDEMRENDREFLLVASPHEGSISLCWNSDVPYGYKPNDSIEFSCDIWSVFKSISVQFYKSFHKEEYRITVTS